MHNMRAYTYYVFILLIYFLSTTSFIVTIAETQSILLQKFIKSFPLTSIEQGVLARGRNAVLTAKKKGKSANNSGGASAYQDSTAFEALIGYTYINDKKRFNEMMTWIQTELDAMDGLPPGS